MAQLNVQPKKPTSWWIWLIAAIIAIALIFILMRSCKSKNSAGSADTSTMQSDSMHKADATDSASNK